MPDGLSEMKRLKILDASDNYFQRLPEINCVELEFINLSKNEIERLPLSLGKLKKLKYFDCSENMLQDLDFMDMGCLESLEDLVLYTNQIRKVPTSIGKCPKLLRLEINNNEVTTLPREIGNCVQLEELVCHSNRLLIIPQTINRLERLVNLDFNKNNIFEIPEELFSISSLRLLSLRENDIEKISSNIKNLTSLKIFDLADNCIEKLPKEICDLNLDALWLTNNQADSKVFYNLTRVKDDDKYVTSFLLPQAKFLRKMEIASAIDLNGTIKRRTKMEIGSTLQSSLARTMSDRRRKKRDLHFKDIAAKKDSFRHDLDGIPRILNRKQTIKRDDHIDSSDSEDVEDESSKTNSLTTVTVGSKCYYSR